jgi:hypothetical protein
MVVMLKKVKGKKLGVKRWLKEERKKGLNRIKN